MKRRSDGIETRTRILEAASRVFAEKGFRDTTIADICQGARTNIALVNYHFRDKESLYVEVWQNAAREANDLYPVDGGLASDAPPEQRLRAHLRALTRRMADQGRLGYFQRLRVMEMANPTGIIDEVRWRAIKPLREFLQRILRQLLGPGATRQDLAFCEISVIGPILTLCLVGSAKVPKGLPRVGEEQMEDFTEHLTGFALAGIEAASRRIRARPHKPRRRSGHES